MTDAYILASSQKPEYIGRKDIDAGYCYLEDSHGVKDQRKSYSQQRIEDAGNQSICDKLPMH